MIPTISRQHLTQRAGVWVVDGRKAIASILGCSVRTVGRYAQLDSDPLPVRRNRVNGRWWIPEADLMAWLRRQEQRLEA